MLLPPLLAAVALGATPSVLLAADVFEYGPFRLQRYTEADGLVSAETNGIYRDRNGFLWISTFAGISRFDGRHFQNFDRQNGLTESNVDILGDDDAGHLFIKSVSNVYRYTGNGVASFVKYPVKGNFIAAACPVGSGNVWVAYEGETSLYLLTAGGPESRLATIAPVYKLLPGLQGEIYVLEMNGRLSVLKNGRLQTVYTVRAKPPYQNEGIQLYRDAAGKIWSYGANNAYVYAHQGQALTDSIAVPPGTRWWQWAAGAANNLYLPSDTGNLAQLINGRWEEILTRTQIRGSVYDVREQRDGTIWICSSGGLLRINRKQYTNTEPSGPLVYYTTNEKGQTLLHSDSLLYSLPGAVRSFQLLKPRVIASLYLTRQKELWFCTEEAIYHLPYGKTLQRLNTANTYEGKKAVFRFRRVMEDEGGGLWILSYHGVFYKKGDSLRYYFNREGLTEGALYTMALDAAGTFYTAGVHVYALVNGRFQNLSPRLGLPDEISRLATDANKVVWVCQEGTNTAVKIGVANGSFYRADSVKLALNGLPFSAGSLCFDEANNLWLCNHRALYCYQNKGSGYASSPLLWNESFSGSPLLFRGTGNSLQVFSHPLAGNDLRTYNSAGLLQSFSAATPAVRLTAVQLYKEAVDWQAAGFATDVLGVPQNLRLTHNQNFVSFFFTGLTPDYSRSVAYRYRLLGYDAAWSPATETGEAAYTGLPSGTYTLEVQSRSAGGEWSRPLSYRFSVAAVWYLTWWAKILGALALAGLVLLFVYLRSQTIRRKARIQQMLAEEQLKALQAQINPHFLQNTFAFLAHELYAAQNTKAVKAVDRLSVYLRGVLRYSDKAAITLEEELEFAEEYLQMQQQLLSVSFQYAFTVQDDVDVFDVQVPAMLLQPLIENALKHGLNPSGQNQVSITVRTDGPYLVCEVADTGNGGRYEQPFQSSGTRKGIALTKERMHLFYRHKKQPPKFIQQRNAQGGCTVCLLIPLT